MSAGENPLREETGGASPNRFDRYRYVFSAVFFLVLLAGADLVAGRAHARRAQLVLARGRAVERTYRSRDAVYHHDLRPNARVDTAEYGDIIYPLRTNSLGFKDADVRQVDLSASTQRTLFIGDSFTEGIGVAYESTFVGRFAAIAARRSVDVSNAAVASYSPIIYWKKTVDLIDRRRVPVSEVVVFIDISDIQDEVNYYVDSTGRMQTRASLGFFDDARASSKRNAKASRPNVVSLLKTGWKSNSLLYRMIPSSKSAMGPPPQPPPGCKLPRFDGNYECRGGWTSSPAVMAAFGAEGLTLAQAHMSALSEYLRSKQIPLTVVVYPWPQQLHWGDRTSLQVSVWREWAAREHAQFIELFTPFFAAADSTSVHEVVQRYFVHDNVHWNDAGHAMVMRLFSAAYCQPSGALDAMRPLAVALCDSTSVRRGAPLPRVRSSE